MSTAFEATAVVPESGVRPGFNQTGSTIATKLFVKSTTTTTGEGAGIMLPAADTDPTVGVTMAAIATAARGDIQTAGIALVTASEAIAEGAEVSHGSDGKAKTAASGDYIDGVAKMACSADGDVIPVELVGPNSGRVKA